MCPGGQDLVKQCFLKKYKQSKKDKHNTTHNVSPSVEIVIPLIASATTLKYPAFTAEEALFNDIPF